MSSHDSKIKNVESKCQHFCIIVGKNYLFKAIALYNSLERNAHNFRLWICCIDNLTYYTFEMMNLSHAKLIKLEKVEDRQLLKVKKERKINEYCWTLKAPLIHYLLTTRMLESVVYCDADIYFFSDPTPLFDEWGKSSVFLCPQRDSDWVEKNYGLYQAGLIGFKNDKDGLKSLRWWRSQCLDWCFANPVEDKFGDQKYLDKLPTLFSNIKISNHLGINAAPWNCIYNNDYKIEKFSNHLHIEKDPLIAFHFACLQIFSEDEFDLWSLDTLIIQDVINREIYAPYLEELQAVIKMFKRMRPKILNRIGITRSDENGFSSAKTPYKFTPLKRIMNRRNEVYHFCTIVSEEYLVKGLALYESLKNQCDNFHLWICCVDDPSYLILSNMKLSNASILSVAEIETLEYQQVKQTRTLKEYCWTLKPQLSLYVLDNFKEIDRLVYCDADIYFFSHPKPLFDEWGKYSIFMCSQRGTPELTRRYGIYQAGLLGFRQDENSKKILNWWKDRCLEWCFDEEDLEWNRWGDQKYLEHIPFLFENIKIIRNIGVNAAPWNLVMNNLYNIHKNDDVVRLDEVDLVIYHFGSLLILNEEEFDLWQIERLSFTKEMIDYIYVPYIQHLQQIRFSQMEDVNFQVIVEQEKKHDPKNYFRYPSK